MLPIGTPGVDLPVRARKSENYDIYHQKTKAEEDRKQTIVRKKSRGLRFKGFFRCTPIV